MGTQSMPAQDLTPSELSAAKNQAEVERTNRRRATIRMLNHVDQIYHLLQNSTAHVSSWWTKQATRRIEDCEAICIELLSCLEASATIRLRRVVMLLEADVDDLWGEDYHACVLKIAASIDEKGYSSSARASRSGLEAHLELLRARKAEGIKWLALRQRT